jgi:putative transcriptional regulator
LAQWRIGCVLGSVILGLQALDSGCGRGRFAGGRVACGAADRAAGCHGLEFARRSVILMAQHSRDDGALGIVINHPIDSRPIADVLKALGADASGIKNNVRVFLGGPVSPNIAFVIHSADYRRDDTVDIDGRVALTDAAEVLRDIGAGKGPGKSLVALGYAGWGPSQLEDEIASGAWIAVPEDPAVVFDDDRTKVWADALALHKTGR